MAAFFGPEGPRRIDISRLMSKSTQALVADAAKFAAGRGDSELDNLHILRIMADQEPTRGLMERAGAAPATVISAVEKGLPNSGPSTGPGTTTLSPAVRTTVFEAHQLAQAFGSTYIDPEHLFLALAGDQDRAPGRLLASAGITPQGLQEALQGRSAATTKSESATPKLDKFGTDLTERARAGRCRPGDRPRRRDRADDRDPEPPHQEQPGAGRRGRRRQDRDRRGPRPARSSTARCPSSCATSASSRSTCRHARRHPLPRRLRGAAHQDAWTRSPPSKGELIVFIDEVHTVVGAGGGGDGAMDAGNILKPRLARGDLHLVGATTLKEYRKHIEKDPALERRFQPVHGRRAERRGRRADPARTARPRTRSTTASRYTDEALAPPSSCPTATSPTACCPTRRST